MTITACSTPPGRSALALVRISGDAAIKAGASIGLELPRKRGIYQGKIHFEDAELAVDAMVSTGPHSYTGEDTVEILLPGNPYLVQRVLSMLIEHQDVREAGPGEFTARAFGAGRLTLEQAEGVALSIIAEGEAQLAGARSLLEGRTGRRYKDWADRITLLLALVEAGTDFADQEDVTAIAEDDLHHRVLEIASEIGSLVGNAPREVRTGAPVIAMVGEQSAGKSTLFNALLGRRRAVTDPKPGTTRDALAEVLDLTHDAPGAGEAELVDLPGIGDDRAEAERVADRARDADALLVCDPSATFAVIDRLGFAERSIAPADDRCILVRTMADLPLPTGNRADGGKRGMPVCAIDGRNIRALRRAIADLAFGSGASSAIAGVAPRHTRSLLRCADSLRAAADATAAGDELVAQELRAALDAIGELVGRVESDDVLARVFSSFCIGK